MNPTLESFKTLLEKMAQLRGEQGCPWDKQQTHESLKPCLLEESYEVLEAIDSKDPKALQEELGDLLLQVVFHAQIASEAGRFGMKEIIEQLSTKLKRRHPHVFGTKEIKFSVENPEQAIALWEKLKAQEKPEGRGLFAGLPKGLPALLRAYRVGAKAGRVGFDWSKLEGVWQKVEEELAEFKIAIQSHTPEAIEEELGDLLFSLAQVGRFLKVNPEESLRQATYKFQRRFEWMEAKIKAQSQQKQDLAPEAWEKLWYEAKIAIKSKETLQK